MNIFVSWSQELSKLIALEFCEWIKNVIQTAKPFFSPNIEKGARWGTEIFGSLESINYGVIFLTQSNLNQPWINFEAGALSKFSSSSRISCVLIDLKTSDISGPLSHFQHTTLTKDDFFSLIESINNFLPDRIEHDVLNRVFNKFWPDFEEKFTELLASNSQDSLESPSPSVDIQEMILKELREQQRTITNGDFLAPVMAMIYNLERTIFESRRTKHGSGLGFLSWLEAENEPTGNALAGGLRPSLGLLHLLGEKKDDKSE